MSRPQRLDMIDRDHPHLSLSRQCQLLALSRSSLYYQSSPVPAEELELMRRLDEQYLQTPFYGTRRMTQHLRRLGYLVTRCAGALPVGRGSGQQRVHLEQSHSLI